MQKQKWAQKEGNDVHTKLPITLVAVAQLLLKNELSRFS
jgi:hypothetical protein